MTAMQNLRNRAARYQLVDGSLVYYPADDTVPAVHVPTPQYPTVADLLDIVRSHRVPVLDVECGRTGCTNQVREVRGRAAKFCSRDCQVAEYRTNRTTALPDPIGRDVA